MCFEEICGVPPPGLVATCMRRPGSSSQILGKVHRTLRCTHVLRATMHNTHNAINGRFEEGAAVSRAQTQAWRGERLSFRETYCMQKIPAESRARYKSHFTAAMRCTKRNPMRWECSIHARNESTRGRGPRIQIPTTRPHPPVRGPAPVWQPCHSHISYIACFKLPGLAGRCAAARAPWECARGGCDHVFQGLKMRPPPHAIPVRDLAIQKTMRDDTQSPRQLRCDT